MIGRTVLHYSVTAELGAGAMGRVYLARDERTGRRVALKFLAPEAAGDDEARARLLREATAAARLSHPNVVTLLAAEETAGELFLVEEYVEGESLARRLERGPLGPVELPRLARALTGALAHAHAHGVLHRDLKPANVLVAGDGTYKIADFGIARVEGEGTLTATGDMVGTLAYLAPERVSGHRGDARADLFALGAVLYEAMTGRRAFAGGSEAEVLHAVLNEAPRPPEAATAALLPLAELTMRLLAKDPAQRPPSAEAVLEALATMRPDAPRVAERRRGWLAPALAFLAVAVVVGAGAWLLRDRLAPGVTRLWRCSTSTISRTRATPTASARSPPTCSSCRWRRRAIWTCSAPSACSTPCGRPGMAPARSTGARRCSWPGGRTPDAS